MVSIGSSSSDQPADSEPPPRPRWHILVGFLATVVLFSGFGVIVPDRVNAAAEKRPKCNMRAEWGHANLAAEAPVLFAFKKDRMAGEHAALIQALLAAHLGLDLKDHVDGWWGPGSMEDLLLPFQRRYFSGRDIDGIAGPQVYGKLSDLFDDKLVKYVEGSHAVFRMPSIKGGHTNFRFNFKAGRQGKWVIPTYKRDAPRRCGYRNLNREDRGGDAGIITPDTPTQERGPLTFAPTTDGSYTGGMSVCPVTGKVALGVDWQAARSGGRRHQGNDIFTPIGRPVVAPASGWAWFTRNGSREGNSFRINSDDGSHYYFGGHMDTIADDTPRHVEAGEVLGTLGKTGNARNTPPHLHFEIGPNGRFGNRINPRPLLLKVCQT